MTKIENWDKTLWLFANEYKVPYLSVPLAAFLATIAELLCPVLLIIGLGTRFAAIVLLIMTAVIEFTYMHFDEHYYWAMLLSVLLFYGAGKLSFDHAIRLRYWGKN